jgi:hypothetical protein
VVLYQIPSRHVQRVLARVVTLCDTEFHNEDAIRAPIPNRLPQDKMREVLILQEKNAMRQREEVRGSLKHKDLVMFGLRVAALSLLCLKLIRQNQFRRANTFARRRRPMGTIGDHVADKENRISTKVGESMGESSCGDHVAVNDECSADDHNEKIPMEGIGARRRNNGDHFFIDYANIDQPLIKPFDVISQHRSYRCSWKSCFRECSQWQRHWHSLRGDHSLRYHWATISSSVDERPYLEKESYNHIEDPVRREGANIIPEDEERDLFHRLLLMGEL